MKYALAVCVVVVAAVVGAHAQDYYYGSEPAPSMYAAQVGQMQAAPFVNENGQPIPAAPSMDAIMAGNQMMAPQPYMNQPMGQFEPQPAFVEQPQMVVAQAPYATQEAGTSHHHFLRPTTTTTTTTPHSSRCTLTVSVFVRA